MDEREVGPLLKASLPPPHPTMDDEITAKRAPTINVFLTVPPKIIKLAEAKLVANTGTNVD